MDIWFWTLLIGVGAAIYYYFKKSLSYFEDLGIPYLPGWPILGNMGAPTFHLKHVSKIVVEIYYVNPEAKYVGAFDFVRPIFVLRDPELIKNVTMKSFDNFPDHKMFIDESVDPLFGSNLFNISGDKWREARALLSPAFTSSKMKAMYELMVECAEDFVKHLSERKESENRMVGAKDLFGKYTNDVIATCAFGIKLNTMTDPTNEFYVLGRKATNLEGILSLKFFIARAFPWLLRLLQITFVSKEVRRFFESIVTTTVKTRDNKGITRPDMLQLMMDARGKGSKHLKLDITEMTAQAFIFFFGGFDASSTQMCILAHCLVIYPDIHKRLQEEVDEVIKKTNGKPTYETINDMPYLEAVFRESMRRHTQVSFIDRLCSSSYELPPALPGGKSITLQPSMNIWVPSAAIHMDPKYYDDPEKFDPDRFLDKKVTTSDATNLGFGIGPRSCIGNRFAILETKVLFFHLLAKFNLKANEKTCIPFEYSKSTFAITPKGGYWLTLEPRK